MPALGHDPRDAQRRIAKRSSPSHRVADAAPLPEPRQTQQNSKLHRLPSSALAAALFQQPDVAHHHAAVDGLAHVVDGQQPHLHGGRRTASSLALVMLYCVLIGSWSTAIASGAVLCISGVSRNLRVVFQGDPARAETGCPRMGDTK